MSEDACSSTPKRTSSFTSGSTSVTKLTKTIKKKKLEKRPYMIVPSDKRLKLVAMIATFGLTCYQAAKIQDIPYTNAKVIYRAYKLNKDPSLHALDNLHDDASAADGQTKELQHRIWKACLRELAEKMSADFFTER